MTGADESSVYAHYGDRAGYLAEVRRLLATDPNRVLMLFVVVDTGPTQDETHRTYSANSAMGLHPSLALPVIEAWVARLLACMSDADREAYLAPFTDGEWDTRELEP